MREEGGKKLYSDSLTWPTFSFSLDYTAAAKEASEITQGFTQKKAEQWQFAALKSFNKTENTHCVPKMGERRENDKE